MRLVRGCRTAPIRLATGLVIIVVATMAITMAIAISPKILGQWFMLYEETDGGNLVYKVEARVTGVKTATLDVEVRVTNHHAFGVHVMAADFAIVDLQQGRTTLTFSLPESTIPASSLTTIPTTAELIKVLGVGNEYLVEGSLTWYEVYGSSEIGPFSQAFSEIHTVSEFT